MKKIFYIVISIIPMFLQAQQVPQKDIRKGNQLYEEKQFAESETSYRKALLKDNQNIKAQYNLGNALYKQQNADSALKLYNNVAENPKASESQRAKALYNAGNAHMAKQEYQEAIDAYKKSLKIQPKDEDTKYNLAYALQKMQQQQQQQQQKGGGDNKDKKDNKDQKQDQQGNKGKQDNKGDKKDQQNQQQQSGDKQDQQGQKKQGEQGKSADMKQKEAERMLNALQNQEKNTLDKVKKQAIPVQKKQTDKDW